MKKFFRKFKRGEKGFTLIELLIVVAILGVLAAVVVPQVTRFLGRGETEAQAAEVQSVRTAMLNMMVEVGITTITDPVALEINRTNNMAAFPSSTAAAQRLYGGTGGNYLATATTSYWYISDAAGEVTQYTTAP